MRDQPQPRDGAGIVVNKQRAEKEMAALGDEYISTEHFLLALTDKRSGVADVLPSRDSLSKAIAEVRGPHRVTSPTPENEMQALEKFGRDLTAEEVTTLQALANRPAPTRPPRRPRPAAARRRSASAR